MTAPSDEELLALTETIDQSAAALGEAFRELLDAGVAIIADVSRANGIRSAENLNAAVSHPAIADQVAAILVHHGLAPVLERSLVTARAAATEAITPQWERMIAFGSLRPRPVPPVAA